MAFKSWTSYNNLTIILKAGVPKGAFTLANFARDFALSFHVLLNKNYLFSLLNVQASVKSHVKSRQCKRTFMNKKLHLKLMITFARPDPEQN
jgi:hypothetical protein